MQVRTPMGDSLADYDQMLEDWEQLIREGRYSEGLTHLENSLADVPGLPPVEEVLSGVRPLPLEGSALDSGHHLRAVPRKGHIGAYQPRRFIGRSARRR